MFDRPHHQRIARILQALNSDLLLQAECYFAGGTAIALSLAEYRESLDIDFLCASNAGYRLLRNTVTAQGLGALLNTPLPHLREVRTDRYGIRTILEVDNTPIKVEFVREDRITIAGHYDATLGVPILEKSDMYAEKLLANADRGLDKFVKSRDIIDLAMMIDGWGDIPREALNKAYEAYGDHIMSALATSVELIQDKTYLRTCLQAAHMQEELIDQIPAILMQQLHVIRRDNNPSPKPPCFDAGG
jgi:hypothetical protein